LINRSGSDPTFPVWSGFEKKCFEIAKKQQVDHYLIDLFPLNDWLDNPKPSVTNTLFTAPIANQQLVVTTRPSFYGIYYYPYDLLSTEIIKDFNCLMNRMDPFRQSWLYQLIRRDIFNRAFVSFNLDVSRIPCYQDRDPKACFNEQFENQMKIFQIEHDSIKHRVPYKNFDDSGDITHVIMKSKFSIVLETYFAESYGVTFSEKIFRCLQMPRPWLLFSHPHAVSTLRHMGFDVLDDIVNHDRYDTIDWAVDRQSKILDIAQEMCDSVFDSIRLINAARHNQNLLAKFWSSCEADYIDCVNAAARFT